MPGPLAPLEFALTAHTLSHPDACTSTREVSDAAFLDGVGELEEGGAATGSAAASAGEDGAYGRVSMGVAAAAGPGNELSATAPISASAADMV